MKKKLLFLPLLATIALGGCSFLGGNKEEDKKTSGGDDGGDDSSWVVVPEIEGGTDAEKNAILEAVNNRSICINKAGADLFPISTNIDFKEDEEDYIKVAKTVKVDTYTVELTWNFNETQATFSKKVAVDSNTDIVYIKYPGYGGTNGTFSWSISKIVCGGAVSTKTNSDYSAKVSAATIEYKSLTMEEIYGVVDEEQTFTVGGKDYTFPSTSNMLDYEYTNSGGTYQVWWNTGRDPSSDNNYLFVEVSGKIIFTSEDGNWGLLANGDHVLEFYSGSQLDLNTKSYPEMDNGYVTMKGELTHYYGNFQLSFVKSIKACAASLVTEPTMTYHDITESDLAGLKAEGFTGYKQFSADIEHNELASVTGVISGDKVSGSNGRFTFEMSVGEEKITVAYDYHTDRSSGTVKNALNAAYSKGETITIKGTLRFTHGIEKTVVPTSGAGGEWTIVPFDASHIVK